MGIELPPELADVAAAAGVRWPEADEDAMASSAAAWRQAGLRLTALSSDADAGAHAALATFDGDANEAARRYWNRYVREDGRLPTAIRACTAAADRLEHGASRVAHAKVELIRQLIALKQQQDAARTAHAVGYVSPLAALTMLLTGTTSNVAQVQSQLTRTIGLDNAPAVASGPVGDTPATATGTVSWPGHHGGGPAVLEGVISGDLPLSGAPVDGVISDPRGAATGVVDGPGNDVLNLLAPTRTAPSSPGGPPTLPVAGAVDPPRPPEVPTRVDQALASPPVTPVPGLGDTSPAPGGSAGGYPGGGSPGGSTGGVPGGVSGGLPGVAPGGPPVAGGPRGVLPGVPPTAPVPGGGTGTGAPVRGIPVSGLVPGLGSGGGTGVPGVPGGGSAAGPGGGAAGPGGSSGGSGGGTGAPTLRGAPGVGAPGGVPGAVPGAVPGGTAGGSTGMGAGSGTPRGGAVPVAAPAVPGQRPAGPGAGSGGPAAGSGGSGAGSGGSSPGARGATGVPAGAVPGSGGAPGAGPASRGPAVGPGGVVGAPGGVPTGGNAPGGNAPGGGSPGSRVSTGPPAGAQEGGTAGGAPAGRSAPGSGGGAGGPASRGPVGAQAGVSTGGVSGSGVPAGSAVGGAEGAGSRGPAAGTGTGSPATPNSSGQGSGGSGSSGSGTGGSGFSGHGGGAGQGGGGQAAQGQHAQQAQHDGGDDQNRGAGDPRKARPGVLAGMPSGGDAGGALDRSARSGRLGGEEALSLFLLFLFPPDQVPEPARRPARQVPVQQAEETAPAGLSVPPGDHPRSELVDATPAAVRAERLQHPAGCSADHELVRALTAGHDPLGGLHERDWDHRFLVREAQPEHGVPAEYAWPPAQAYPEGACAPDAVEPAVLEPGTVLDRFGDPAGRLLAADGTPFAQRSLPPDYQYHGYHRYRVERPLPVWRTVGAAWFGQPGGGVRYRTTHPVEDLLALGHLADVTPTATITVPATAASNATAADATADAELREVTP